MRSCWGNFTAPNGIFSTCRSCCPMCTTPLWWNRYTMATLVWRGLHWLPLSRYKPPQWPKYQLWINCVSGNVSTAQNWKDMDHLNSPKTAKWNALMPVYWKYWLPLLSVMIPYTVMAYCTTKHSFIGLTPNMMLFGCDIIEPISLIASLPGGMGGSWKIYQACQTIAWQEQELVKSNTELCSITLD